MGTNKNDFKKEYQQIMDNQLARGMIDGLLDFPTSCTGNWAAAAHDYLLNNHIYDWANNKVRYEAYSLLADIKNELDYILAKADVNPCDLLVNPAGVYMALKIASKYYFEEVFDSLIYMERKYV